MVLTTFIATLRISLLDHRKLKDKRKAYFDIEALKDPKIQRKFIAKIDTNIKNLNLHDIDSN